MIRRGSAGHDYSDTELIIGCRAGKALHRELLYKRYFSFAMSVCIRYANDENMAMEIVNDSYMKVLDNIETCDISRPFRSWYGRILVNTAIDSYRKNLRHNLQVPLESVAGSEEADPEIESDLTVNDIIALLNKLPDNYRITFNLHEMEGYSHNEIGEMLGIPVSTSRSNLTRARVILRELYSKHFSPERKRNEAV